MRLDEKVGIIIVNYNGEIDTIDCVRSLEKIKYNNYEIIIIDNNSNSKSKEILKHKINKNVKIIFNDKNLGFSGANNIGIKYALNTNCEYILLLNNDTEVEEYFLDEMIKTSKVHNNCIVSPKIYYFYEPNKIWSAGGYIDWSRGITKQYGLNQEDSEIYNKENEIEFSTGCCMLIHKSIIEKVGYLSEEYFLYYEDTDYCVRAKEQNIKIIYNPNAIVWHKVSSSTGGNYSPLTLYYSNRNRLYFNKKYNKHKNKSNLYFYITRIIKIIQWSMCGEVEKIQAVKLGISDFKNNIMGKRYYTR